MIQTIPVDKDTATHRGKKTMKAKQIGEMERPGLLSFSCHSVTSSLLWACYISSTVLLEVQAGFLTGSQKFVSAYWDLNRQAPKVNLFHQSLLETDLRTAGSFVHQYSFSIQSRGTLDTILICGKNWETLIMRLRSQFHGVTWTIPVALSHCIEVGNRGWTQTQPRAV